MELQFHSTLQAVQNRQVQFALLPFRPATPDKELRIVKVSVVVALPAECEQAFRPIVPNPSDVVRVQKVAVTARWIDGPVDLEFALIVFLQIRLNC